MEKTSPTNQADAWPSRQQAGAVDENPEITRLKERLGFYESFDQLIQDNVSRASELLKHAAAMRETSEIDLAASRREMEALRSEDRQEFRAVLSGLLDDVTSMQVQIERLARRVADALDDIEVTLPAGGEIRRLSAATAAAETGETVSADSAPLSLDPTPDEIGPPEPAESEAAFRGIVTEEHGEEVEAEVAAAHAAEVTVPGGNGLAAAGVTAEESRGDPFARSAGPVQSDALAAQAVDEVVQPTVEEPIAWASSGIPADPAADDGVISDVNAVGSSAIASAYSTVEHAAPAVTPEELDAQPAQAVDERPPEPAPTRLSWISQDVRPFSVEGIGSGVADPGTTEPRTPEPLPRPESVSSSLPSSAVPGVATAVLVHGVPRATMALSLKRFLEGLPQVSGVEPREYAEGVLRLQVTGERPLQIEDLRSWPDGAGMEPIHLRDDLIEVRLPH